MIDFDASRQYKSERNTSDTRLLGTIEYAAPEQFGYAQTDPRSDIYSLGVVFSEIKTFENLPWSRTWKRIVDKCTSFDPENRYQNVTQVKKDLLVCFNKEKHPRRTAFLLLGTVLTVCLMVGLWMLFADEEAMVPPTDPSSTPSISPTSEPMASQEQEPTDMPQSTNTPIPTEALQETLTPTTYPEYEGIVLQEDELVWNTAQEETKVIRLHPKAPCSIKQVFWCRQALEEDPYSEVRELLPENTYILSSDKKELELLAGFCTLYPKETEAVLYLEFTDGRGERVWIQFTE